MSSHKLLGPKDLGGKTDTMLIIHLPFFLIVLHNVCVLLAFHFCRHSTQTQRLKPKTKKEIQLPGQNQKGREKAMKLQEK